MKFFLSVLLIALLSAVAEYFLPWWTMVIVAFVVVLVVRLRPARAFLAGFIGVAIFWLIAALVKDIPNEHLLSGRMAVLFHLPSYSLFIVVTVFVGGVIGGLSSCAAALLRKEG